MPSDRGMGSSMSPLGFWERGGIVQYGFWMFVLCECFSVGEPVGGWSLICPIQAVRSQSPLPRTRLSFEQKELWEKRDLPGDWLVNF